MLSFLSLQIFTIGSSCKAALFDMRMTMEHVYYSSGIPDNRVSKIISGKKKFLFLYSLMIFIASKKIKSSGYQTSFKKRMDRILIVETKLQQFKVRPPKWLGKVQFLYEVFFKKKIACKNSTFFTSKGKPPKESKFSS